MAQEHFSVDFVAELFGVPHRRVTIWAGAGTLTGTRMRPRYKFTEDDIAKICRRFGVQPGTLYYRNQDLAEELNCTPLAMRQLVAEIIRLDPGFNTPRTPGNHRLFGPRDVQVVKHALKKMRQRHPGWGMPQQNTRRE